MYVSRVTSSFAVFSTLMTTEVLEVTVGSDLREMVRLKVREVREPTLGATKLAVWEEGFWMVAC